MPGVRNTWSEEGHEDGVVPSAIAIEIERAMLGLRTIEQLLQRTQLECSRAGCFVAQQDVETVRQDVEDLADDLRQVLVEAGYEEQP